MSDRDAFRDGILTILADKDIECGVDSVNGKHYVRLTVLTDSMDVPLPSLEFDGTGTDLAGKISVHLLSNFYPTEFVQEMLDKGMTDEGNLNDVANTVEAMLENAADALDDYIAAQED